MLFRAGLLFFLLHTVAALDDAAVHQAICGIFCGGFVFGVWCGRVSLSNVRLLSPVACVSSFTAHPPVAAAQMRGEELGQREQCWLYQPPSRFIIN